MEKMTNVKALAYVLEHYEMPTEVAEKLTKMMEQTAKHNASKSSKPTKKQSENEVLKEQILGEMLPNMEYTVGQMVKEFASCSGLSSQKVSAMVNQMATSDIIVKRADKRTSYFSLKAEE